MKARKHITRFTIVMVMAVLAVGVFAGAALATGESNAETVGAMLTGTANPTMSDWTPGAFPATLTGANAILAADGAGGTTAFGSFTVTDATGTGDGWYVQVKAETFHTTTQINGETKVVHPNALHMPEFAISHTTDASADPHLETGYADYNGTTHYLTVGTTDTTVAHADGASDAGMGQYTFAPSTPWLLDIPADVYEATYHSEITITVATSIQG